MTLAPRPYQGVGRDFLAARSCALLADEMRVGKTPQAILAAEKLGAQSLTVICPAIAIPQWQREIGRWWQGPQPKHQVLSYDRARALWRQGVVRAGDVLIADECHFAKNPDSQRTKALYGKDGYAASAGTVWALSGTPAPKHAAELWPMLRAFGKTDMPYEFFVHEYCTVNPYTERITGTKLNRTGELKALLSGFMLRRKRADVAPELPDIGFNMMAVAPSAPADFNAVAADDETLAAWMEANAVGEREDRIAVALSKVPALADEIVFAVENELYAQTVVFGWHREPLTELCSQLRGKDVAAYVLNGDTGPRDREVIQSEFRAGRAQVVCANIAAAGTAIDLSTASHGYFLEQSWVPGENMQAANRLVSMTKKDKVTFDVLTAQGTMDERMQNVLLRRARELATLI